MSLKVLLESIPRGSRLVGIVGPTACGKSDWAIELCRALGGEVISADSRQVYRGLDIGTGKVRGHLDRARGRTLIALGREYQVAPFVSEGVDHWLLDVADPRHIFTAAEFQVLAYHCVADILARGRLPLLVGGTGLYVSAVIDGLVMPEVPPNPSLRVTLEHLSAEQLRTRLLALDPDAGEVVDLNNPRRMVRAIEVAGAAGPLARARSMTAVPFETLLVGVRVDRPELLRRIHQRLLRRLDEGMIDEVRGLLDQGVSHERLEDLGLEYRYVGRHLQGQLSYEQLVDELNRAIARFARRQATWFRKHGPVEWMSTAEEALRRVQGFKTSS